MKIQCDQDTSVPFFICNFKGFLQLSDAGNQVSSGRVQQIRPSVVHFRSLSKFRLEAGKLRMRLSTSIRIKFILVSSSRSYENYFVLRFYFSVEEL